MTKNFCPTHHLYYTGTTCPMCLSERSEAMARRFYKEEQEEPVEEKKEEVKEVSEESLLALVAKFNRKK